MPASTLVNARIVGIASAVPSTTVSLPELGATFGDADAAKISDSAGVRVRHVVQDDSCTSDYCFVAAERILEEAAWDRSSVDALIFVSQTPDYVLPATACSLHGRLGLAKTCAAFDVGLGCSGYIYGLWQAYALIAAGAAQRVMVLAGDTSSRVISPLDRSTAPLFGDAGTATLIERSEGASASFVIGTDGRGSEHLIIPAGGMRSPRTADSCTRTARDGGNIRSDEDLYMNGMEIFTFTLREVPPLIDGVLERAGWSRESVDAYVFHQANRMMLVHLGKKMKLPSDRVVIAMEEYGNTSSASIPLAISAALRGRADHGPMKLVLAGFGVGFSWGAMALESTPMILPEVIEHSAVAATS